MCVNFCAFGLVFLIAASSAQRDVALPLSSGSFRQILRTFMPDVDLDRNILNVVDQDYNVLNDFPAGRAAELSDVRIRYYGANSTKPSTYRLRNVTRLLSEPTFDVTRPTTLYIHGYVELWNDPSVETVARAYRQRGPHNLLLLDWGNLGFGDYIGVGLRVEPLGLETGKAMWKLFRSGLPLATFHLVGHSMGVGIAGVIGRYLASKGFTIPRLTGLDPAYPGFYPALLAPPVRPSDAIFVDIVHTDGGGYGAPVSTGHADFWPNAGSAKQPGCLPLTLPLTTEDFCSHWRSWQYWAEAVASPEPVFLARRCDDYDSFLRGSCRDEPLVAMGIDTDPTLRGNFYLRTAAREPFALGERGAG